MNPKRKPPHNNQQIGFFIDVSGTPSLQESLNYFLAEGAITIVTIGSVLAVLGLLTSETDSLLFSVIAVVFLALIVLTLPLMIVAHRDYQRIQRKRQKRQQFLKLEAIRILEIQDFTIRENTTDLLIAERSSDSQQATHWIELEGDAWYDDLIAWLEQISEPPTTALEETSADSKSNLNEQEETNPADDLSSEHSSS